MVLAFSWSCIVKILQNFHVHVVCASVVSVDMLVNSV